MSLIADAPNRSEERRSFDPEHACWSTRQTTLSPDGADMHDSAPDADQLSVCRRVFHVTQSTLSFH